MTLRVDTICHAPSSASLSQDLDGFRSRSRTILPSLEGHRYTDRAHGRLVRRLVRRQHRQLRRVQQTRIRLAGVDAPRLQYESRDGFVRSRRTCITRTSRRVSIRRSPSFIDEANTPTRERTRRTTRLRRETFWTVLLSDDRQCKSLSASHGT